MAIYLNIPTASGNVTTDGFKNWIEVSDIEFSGVSAPVKMHIGNSIDRNSSRATFGEVTIIKNQIYKIIIKKIIKGSSLDRS
jgi:hypothetical protein